jgi:hypothetical protein
MTAWWFLLLAGIGTAAFRLVPQVVAAGADDGTGSEVLRDAGTAALVAMTVGSVVGLAEGTLPLAGVVVALAAGAFVAHRSGHLLATVGSGLAAFWLVGIVV